jgi:hypothetical protein
MKRFLAISMMLVVAGSLMLPAFAANLFSCSMRCCRRFIKHSHCDGMTARNKNGRNPEIDSVAKGCQGGCFLKGPGGQSGLASLATTSAIFHSHAPKIPPLSQEGAEPKLLTHAGRAPPLGINRA